MEKLKRVYQKIFAGKSGNDETVAFGSTAQGSTVYTKELADIQTDAFEEGIKSSLVAGEAPIWEDNNSVFYEITSQLAYLFQQGIAEWDSETTYFIGSFCTVINENNVNIYYSLTDNNTGNNPTTDNTNWKNLDLTTEKANQNGSNVNEDFFLKATISENTVDYIVEAGTNDNGWYRKYKSGWIEQGGSFTRQSSDMTITLPAPMTTDSYNIQYSKYLAPAYWASSHIVCQSKTTTNMVFKPFGDNSSYKVFYYICGF